MSYGIILIILSIALIGLYIQLAVKGVDNWVTMVLLIVAIISLAGGQYFLIGYTPQPFVI